MPTEPKQGKSKPRKAEPRVVTEQQVFPTRLRELMEEHGTTQKELAAAIGMRPQTVSLYTGGQSAPDINCLYKIAEYFDVTADWLIGRPNSTKTIKEDIQAACKTTGLSEDSVKQLSHQWAWGIKDTAETIDFLLFDNARRYPGHDFRSVLDLLHFFLSYDDKQAIQKQVFINGAFADIDRNAKTISSNAIRINQRVIENAVLDEIQQALISIKKKRLESLEEGKDNGKHHKND